MKMKAFIRILVMMALVVLCIIPIHSIDAIEIYNSHLEAVKAYTLINQRIALSMDENTKEYDLKKLDNELQHLGVRDLSFVDVVNELGLEAGMQIMSNYPNPGSNDKVHFYSVYDYLDDGQQIYCLICSPYENSSHSGNRTTGEKTLTSYVTSGATTMINLYGSLRHIDNIFTNVTCRAESLYEIFPDFLNNSSGQVSEYSAEMRTRTVTMFVYSKNSTNDVVYYGSTNCVHVNIDHTVIKNTNGSPHRGITTSDLILADDYYDFAVNVVSANPSGYNIVIKHSYVSGVIMEVGGNRALSQSIPCYDTLIQAIY